MLLRHVLLSLMPLKAQNSEHLITSLFRDLVSNSVTTSDGIMILALFTSSEIDFRQPLSLRSHVLMLLALMENGIYISVIYGSNIDTPLLTGSFSLALVLNSLPNLLFTFAVFFPIPHLLFYFVYSSDSSFSH